MTARHRRAFERYNRGPAMTTSPGVHPLSVKSSALHTRAIAFMVVAAVCWSSGGLLVRQLSIVGAWEIVFWRSASLTTCCAHR